MSAVAGAGSGLLGLVAASGRDPTGAVTQAVGAAARMLALMSCGDRRRGLAWRVASTAPDGVRW